MKNVVNGLSDCKTGGLNVFYILFFVVIFLHIHSTTENEVIKDNISISPNPFKDFIQIHFGDTLSDFEISMYDMQGKQVFNQVLRKEKSVKIHLPNLEKGVYLFHMKSKDHQISRKVIKK